MFFKCERNDFLKGVSGIKYKVYRSKTCRLPICFMLYAFGFGLSALSL